MKNTIAAVLVSFFSWGIRADTPFTLEVKSPVRTLRLGQEVRLKLRIAGSGVNAITRESEGIDADYAAGDSVFEHEIRFKPQRTGRFTFGPYAIDMNGAKLTSNSISVDVLPQWDGQPGMYFRVDTNAVVLGDEVELTVESWSKKGRPQSVNLSLDRNENFTARSGWGISFSRITTTDEDMSCSQTSWFICPKKAGIFKIDKNLFKDFPVGTTPPDIAILVKESDHPSAKKLPEVGKASD